MPTATPFDSLLLSNSSTATYGLSNYFVDPQSSPLYYWVASDSNFDNATISPEGAFTVGHGRYRDRGHRARVAFFLYDEHERTCYFYIPG